MSLQETCQLLLCEWDRIKVNLIFEFICLFPLTPWSESSLIEANHQKNLANYISSIKQANQQQKNVTVLFGIQIHQSTKRINIGEIVLSWNKQVFHSTTSTKTHTHTTMWSNRVKILTYFFPSINCWKTLFCVSSLRLYMASLFCWNLRTCCLIEQKLW